MRETAIARAVEGGRLHRVFRAVYAVGHPGISRHGRLFAATLACGQGAVVSHRSAGALLGLLDRAPAVIDVISPGSRGRGIDGVRAYRARAPRATEVGVVDRIPCTSPARTMVDLAAVVSDRTLRSCFERSAARGTLDLDAIEVAMEPLDAIEVAMEPGPRPGAPSLRALIEEWRPAAPVARTGRLKSPLEARVLPLLTRRGLPAPLSNAPVQLAGGRIEVDFLWPVERVVVEADSRGFHANAVAFERDRRRDRELARAGYATLRVTSRQAGTEAEAVAAAVRALLERDASSR